MLVIIKAGFRDERTVVGFLGNVECHQAGGDKHDRGGDEPDRWLSGK